MKILQHRDGIMCVLRSIVLKAPWGVAIGFGSLLALTQAPFYYYPLLLISFSGLLIFHDFLLKRGDQGAGVAPCHGVPVPSKFTSKFKGFKKSFGLGWFFGLGFHVFGLYWIAFSLGVDLDQFWWLIPFTVLGLPAFFSLWSGLALALASLRTSKKEKTILFIALWSFGEWARGHCFTGFPWNLVGYCWGFSLEMLQSTCFLGIYGLTLVSIGVGCLPYILKIFWEQNLPKSTKVKKISWGAFISILSMGTLFLYGKKRLETPPPGYEPRLILRLVQPNIPQTLKWDPLKVQQNYKKLLDLSSLPEKTKVTHVVWPESAVPFYLEEDPGRRLEVMSHLPQDSVLLTGALRREVRNNQVEKIWNSFLILDGVGRIAGSYDKAHLVPFGEYIPFRRWIPKLVKKITQGSLDFSTGPGPKTLKVPGAPAVAPLICYEGIFPGNVTEPLGGHSKEPPTGASFKPPLAPQWLLNITNDGWFGKTTGPYQHFDSIRIRAIEEGLPLIRVANTGISGVCDAYGRVEKKLGLNQIGILDTPLPRALPERPFYSHYKELLFWLLLGGLFLSVFKNRLPLRE